MADVTERMLALLSALQTGRAFSGEELARHLQVSPRTVRRDVERLRGYGYPVDTRPGPAGYYRLAAGRTLPPLVLDDDEALATLLGLAALAATGPDLTEPAAVRFGSGNTDAGSTLTSLDTAALRAYGKIDQFLPARLRSRAVALRASLETGRQRAPDVTADLLADLAAAIGNREIVTFTYLNARGERSDRRVEPHRHIHQHLRWYLLAWDTDCADWRIFRVDRITGLLRTGARYRPRPLPADSAVDYLRQGLNRNKQCVGLVVAAPAATVADTLAYQDAELTALDDHHTRVTLWLDTWRWLPQSLAFLDADFTIEAPADFRASCADFARRLLTAADSG